MEAGEPKQKRGMDLEPVEDQILDLLILHFFPLRPKGKRGETAAQLIRGVFASLVRSGKFNPATPHPKTHQPIPAAEYEGWDEKIGIRS